MEEEEVKPEIWCFYCDRQFDDEKVLIEHQKARHFKCEQCGKKLSTFGGLVIHVVSVHKGDVKNVPNALPGKDLPQYEVYGMAGIPEQFLPEKMKIARMQQASAQYAMPPFGGQMGGMPYGHMPMMGMPMQYMPGPSMMPHGMPYGMQMPYGMPMPMQPHGMPPPGPQGPSGQQHYSQPPPFYPSGVQDNQPLPPSIPPMPALPLPPAPVIEAKEAAEEKRVDDKDTAAETKTDATQAPESTVNDPVEPHPDSLSVAAAPPLEEPAVVDSSSSDAQPIVAEYVACSSFLMSLLE